MYENKAKCVLVSRVVDVQVVCCPNLASSRVSIVFKMVPKLACHIIFFIGGIAVFKSLDISSIKFAENAKTLSDSFLSEKSRYRVVFVRHGESEWNKKNWYAGWYDAKLTSKGTILFSFKLKRNCVLHSRHGKFLTILRPIYFQISLVFSRSPGVQISWSIRKKSWTEIRQGVHFAVITRSDHIKHYSRRIRSTGQSGSAPIVPFE